MAFRVRFFGYLGILLLILTAGLLAVFGIDAFDPGNTVQLGLLAVAGLLDVVGGFSNPFRERVGAARLVGLANVCLGASIAALATTTEPLVLRVISVLGGLLIAIIGINYLMDGRLFETEMPEIHS